MRTTASVIVFDVTQTLSDMPPMETRFAEAGALLLGAYLVRRLLAGRSCSRYCRYWCEVRDMKRESGAVGVRSTACRRRKCQLEKAVSNDANHKWVGPISGNVLDLLGAEQSKLASMRNEDDSRSIRPVCNS